MTTIIFVVIALLVLVTLGRVLRNGNIREKYAFLWVLVGVATVVLALWPGLLEWLARLVGVAVPSNLLFFLSILMLLGVSLHLSLEVSELEDETRTLAEEVAMLNLRVADLEPPAANRLDAPDPPLELPGPEGR